MTRCSMRLAGALWVATMLQACGGGGSGTDVVAPLLRTYGSTHINANWSGGATGNPISTKSVVPTDNTASNCPPNSIGQHHDDAARAGEQLHVARHPARLRFGRFGLGREHAARLQHRPANDAGQPAPGLRARGGRQWNPFSRSRELSEQHRRECLLLRRGRYVHAGCGGRGPAHGLPGALRAIRGAGPGGGRQSPG
jgi:hypothetical protein